MPRRVSLPGASELFRPTQGEPGRDADEPADESGDGPDRSDGSRGTGRVRHEEKITVYVSTDELIALEQARLRLRAEHGTAVDRGRIVREAVSLALEEFAADGSASALARRLTTS